VNAVGSFTPNYPPGYPKLTLLQKLPSIKDPREECWTPLMVPSPPLPSLLSRS
jgi:hypothetical protein